MPVADAAYQEFVDKANPHRWWLSASNLLEQAEFLRAHVGRGETALTDGDNRLIGRWDSTNKSVFLLSGFALENMIKAFLVFENPNGFPTESWPEIFDPTH